jgi:hypothetical protein
MSEAGQNEKLRKQRALEARKMSIIMTKYSEAERKQYGREMAIDAWRKKKRDELRKAKKEDPEMAKFSAASNRRPALRPRWMVTK